MQQTQKYRFNLIESSDPFSAQPLNDNAEKLEGALTAHQAEVSSALSAHRTEVSAALSAQAAQTAALPRMIAGSYTGTGEYGDYGPDHPTVLEFPEAGRPPQVIFVTDTTHPYYAVLIRGMSDCSIVSEYHSLKISWTDTGVRFYSTESVYLQMNSTQHQYSYVALF